MSADNCCCMIVTVFTLGGGTQKDRDKVFDRKTDKQAEKQTSWRKGENIDGQICNEKVTHTKKWTEKDRTNVLLQKSKNG